MECTIGIGKARRNSDAVFVATGACQQRINGVRLETYVRIQTQDEARFAPFEGAIDRRTEA